MAKNFAQVQNSIDEMTTEDIKTWLGALPDSEVMRSILMAEVNAIRKGAQREQRTLRGLWYDTVKITLSRAGILNKKTKGGKDMDWACMLSRYMTEMVRDGLTTYEELSIIDGSRQRQPAQNLVTKFVNVQMVGAHYPYIILFIEKDTAWPIVRDIAYLYGVSAISGGGQPAFSCTADIINKILDTDIALSLGDNGEVLPITLLSITDYDPTGYIIANAQATQIEEILGYGITHIRLGVVPSQLTPEEREIKSYELKDSDTGGNWFDLTGGVNGQPLGVELDALGVSRIRNLYTKAIEQHIKIDYRIDDLHEAFIDLIACEMLIPEFEKKRAKMIELVKQNGCWEAITKTKIPDNLFMQAAIDGDKWISPEDTKRLFSNHIPQVQTIMGGAR